MQLKHELVLASLSPRRKQLLAEAGFSITVFPVQVSEILEKNLKVQDQIQAISRSKWTAARAEWNQTKVREALLLTADTMVVLDGSALGKPLDAADAILTLEKLSGSVHQVITAISLGLSSSPAPIDSAITTEVHFRPISRQEILDYVATGEPLDKAGSYGIQGLGGKFVSRFVGDFDNVVGLPVREVQRLLRKNHWLGD